MRVLIVAVLLVGLAACEPDDAAPGSLPFASLAPGDCVVIDGLRDAVPCDGAATAEVLGIVTVGAPVTTQAADLACTALLPDDDGRDVLWQTIDPGDDPARLICLAAPPR